MTTISQQKVEETEHTLTKTRNITSTLITNEDHNCIETTYVFFMIIYTRIKENDIHLVPICKRLTLNV